MVSENDINFIFLDGGGEVTYSFRVNRPDLFSRLTVNSSGTLERFTWAKGTKTWSRFWYAPKDQCRMWTLRYLRHQHLTNSHQCATVRSGSHLRTLGRGTSVVAKTGASAKQA